MKFFQEFFIIIFFSVLGEGIRIFAHLPIPGSILGILFLFLAFEMHLVDPEKIGATGDFLLNNLAILFVPAGVGLLILLRYGLFYWEQSSCVPSSRWLQREKRQKV